jgi:hypothetical protein
MRSPTFACEGRSKFRSLSLSSAVLFILFIIHIILTSLWLQCRTPIEMANLDCLVVGHKWSSVHYNCLLKQKKGYDWRRDETSLCWLLQRRQNTSVHWYEQKNGVASEQTTMTEVDQVAIETINKFKTNIEDIKKQKWTEPCKKSSRRCMLLNGVENSILKSYHRKQTTVVSTTPRE